MLKRPSFFIAVIGVIAVIAIVVRLRQAGPEPVPVVPPPQSPYSESIGGRGLVESVNENVRVAPPVQGLVRTVPVAVGTRVKAGDVLFTMDDRQAASDVATQRARVNVEAAKLDEAVNRLADRRDQRDRVKQLRARNVASEDESQRVEFALQAAEREVSRARADYDLAVAQLSAAEVALDLLTVKAPRDGTVLQVNVRAGEFFVPGSAEPAILLGDISELQLRADIDESDAPRLRGDRPAVAFLKGTRERPIPLEFVRIEPYIVPKRSLSGESTERVDTRVLQVIYRFPAPEFPVYAGQQMDVFIEQ